MKQQRMNPQQTNKEMRKIKINIKKKENQNFILKMTLDPCSIRNFTIRSEPFQAAEWRAVPPPFNKQKVVNKRIKTKLNITTHNHSQSTWNNKEWTHNNK